MASPIVHELAFQVSARRNATFDRAFGGAREAVAAMQQQIQTLNQAQNNITGYQRQQSAVDRTQQRLENLRRQYDLIQQEMRETAGSTTTLERESLRLQQRINDTESALGRQRQRLQQTSDALRQAGVNTDNLIGESIRLTDEMRQVQRAQESAASTATSFGSRTADAFDAVGQAIATAGIAQALNGIYDSYMACVDMSGAFEGSMSNIKALSGAGGDDMAMLTNKAKELGATTKFTARESADAMGYMAMAGWDSQQMLAGMDGVLQLAAASGEDLALVSDIVTDSLSAFHLTADDTQHFADVLAAAATNANTNVAIMGETFKNSASIAGALGYSIEDVAMAVGLMANNGIKGSTAGTTLKNIFNGLLDGVTLSGAAFGEYEYSAIKADGTMKSFGDTILELRGYFEQMTTAERVLNAKDIAGAYGYNGLLGILLSAEADYNKLSDSINDCAGAARRMAEIKLDNLPGDITLAQSAAEALETSLGEQFTPAMRKLYQAAAKAFGRLDQFVQDNPALVQSVGAFTGVLGSATLGVTGLSAAIRIFKALNLAALFTGPAGAVIALSGGAAALAAGFVGIRSGANDAVPVLRDLTKAVSDSQQAMNDADAAYRQTVDGTLATVAVADRYIDKLEEMGEYEALNDDQKKEYHNRLELLCDTIPELSDYIDLQNDKIEGGTEALRENTEAWKTNAVEKAKQQQMEQYAGEVVKLEITAAKTGMELTKAQDQQQAAKEAAAAVEAEMNAMYVAAQKNGGELPEEYYELARQQQEYERQANKLARYDIPQLAAAYKEQNEAVAQAQEELNMLSEAFDHMGEAAEAAGDSVADSVDKLDQSKQAEANARATIEAYIMGIYSMIPKIGAAFGSIAGMLPVTNSAYSIMLDKALALNAYATGTNSAASGWALVGEEGPELMYMQGGERVIPAAASAEMLGSGGTTQLVFSPEYHISGNMDPDKLERILREHDAELTEQIVDFLDNRAVDRRRLSYW